MWKGKTFYIILLVFLFLAVPGILLGDVVLSDQEYEELMMYLDKLETNQEDSNQKIINLQNQLDFSKTVIINLENSLMTSGSIIQSLKGLLQEQEIYYSELKKNQWISNLEFFGIGFITGFVGGGFTGFELAINIKY